MKVSKSIEDLYQVRRENAVVLEQLLKQRFKEWCATRGWHFECRIKEPESYAQKIEQSHNKEIHDVFAGAIIVHNPREAIECSELLEREQPKLGIKFKYKKPRDLKVTRSNPETFMFDSIRMYFKAEKPDIGTPQYLKECFEIQIKTLIDEAWGKVSHKFTYKPDEDLSWAKSRLMSQIKALLESAELALSEAESISKSGILQKTNKEFDNLNEIMSFYREIWPAEFLPNDMRRLAMNTKDLMSFSETNLPKIKEIIIRETSAGRGRNILNLSPYWIVVQAVANENGWADFLKTINSNLMKSGNGNSMFPIIKEIEYPENINWRNLSRINRIS